MGSLVQHIHLDALGGAAGDMFVAALLHAFPEHEAVAVAAARAASGVACRLVKHRDSVLQGARFEVDAHPHQHHDHDHSHHHGHTPWRVVRARLQGAGLDAAVLAHALGIFGLLAEAEGRVHGVAAEDVTFHEVGHADSLADIVAAAAIVAAIGEARWSVGALPLGSGRVRTEHGPMPVPAPATTLLLEGFEVVDDGIAGERVTPTGAAILRHLCRGSREGLRGRVGRMGIGFGTRTLPGLSNVLRAMVFADVGGDSGAAHRELAVIAFEIDDQSGEDLACGLDRVRALDGVHDVIQAPVFGKKSRLAVHVQVLVRPDALEAAIEACFRETTTIGLRTHLVQGRALKRTMVDVDVDGTQMRVKRVERPRGAPRQADSDDASGGASHAERARLRHDAEQRAESRAESMDGLHG